MLETSKDLLYVVISFSVLWLTIFLSWMIYYLAMILKEGHTIIKDFRQKLDLLDEFLKTVKEKIEHSTSHFVLLVEAVKQLLSFFEKRGKRNKKKEKTKAQILS